MKNKQDNYLDSTHRLGRLGSIGAVLIMIGIPVIIMIVYDAFPPLDLVIQSGSSLLAMFIPLALSEVLSYSATLGSGSYITFITGNVTNLKIPVAINALSMANVEQATEEGDAVVTLAVCASSMITMVIIALGLILMVPLRPVFENPAVVTATKYMLPALLGAVALGAFNSASGKYTIKGKMLAVIPAVLITIILIFVGFNVSLYQGIVIVCMIPVTILFAYLLYNRRVVKIYEKGKTEPEDPDERRKMSKKG